MALGGGARCAGRAALSVVGQRHWAGLARVGPGHLVVVVRRLVVVAAAAAGAVGGAAGVRPGDVVVRVRVVRTVRVTRGGRRRRRRVVVAIVVQGGITYI